MRALALLTSKLTVEIAQTDASSDFAPCVQICRADGTPTGLAFHGVPGGHEFSSFVLGIYNAIGPGQPIDAQLRARIQAISKPTHLTVLVSLSCTMCPDTVVAAQRIAACSEHVTAEVYDIHRFEELRTRHIIIPVSREYVVNRYNLLGKLWYHGYAARNKSCNYLGFVL